MWALLQEIYDKIQAAITAGATFDPRKIMGAQFGWEVGDLYTKADGKGRVEIQGVLTSERDWRAAEFAGGNTVYSAVQQAIFAAAADPEVDTIVLVIDSPGGQLEGMFDVIEAIKAADKPVLAEVHGMAASAAYGIAAAADEIVAMSDMSQVGSIGTLANFRFNEDTITLTNRESPAKAPDLQTEAGKDIVRDHLDAAFDIYAAAIAEGRGIKAEEVAEKYGSGRVFFAAEALERGMLDRVEKVLQNTNPNSTVDANATPAKEPGQEPAPQVTDLPKTPTEANKMNLEQLKAEHPALYAQIVADARAAALAEERDRVKGHLTAARESGEVEVAISAIEDGSGMTSELTAKYMSATARKAAGDSRQGDDVETPDTTSVETPDGDKDVQASADLKNKVFAQAGIKASA